MSFISFTFVIFVTVLVIAYYTVCKKNQWLLLLCGSLVFYCFASVKYLIFLLISIFTAYYAGIVMDRLDKQYEKFKLENSDKELVKNEKARVTKSKKQILTVNLVLNVLILGVLKYTGFFMDSIATILNGIGVNINVPEIDFILPLGISFYTFMTISYLLDVYWGACEAESNLLRYALFISYFPHITSGPIDSYMDLRGKLYENHDFNKDMFKEGLYRILVGAFKKIVIASRLAVYVDAVYGKPDSYGSFTLLCATILYAFQMYCDFSGYVDIAVGVSKLFGIDIFENFDLPYLSRSIPEYWRRWHITLGVWFRSYIFYPVIRSNACKKLSKRLKKNHDKTFASMITTIIGLISVWLLTGLWHGASWHYVMHGVYHGTIIIISTVLAGSYKKWKEALHINDESKLFHVFQIARTFVLVDISYILFRASSLRDAGYIMKQIFFKMSINGAEIKAAILPFTEDNTAIAYGGVAFFALFLLIIADILKYNGKEIIIKKRYFISAVMVLMTLLFGVFGQSSFLYAAY